MSDNGRTSRRSALKRGLLLIGAAVGGGSLAGHAEASPRVGQAKTPDGVRELAFRGRGWHVSAAGRAAGLPLQGGERTQTFGELTDLRGRPAGSFTAASFHLSSPFTHGVGADSSLELHVFSLAGGTILGMGSAAGGDDAFAVVGGTGEFAGARGSYVARQGLRERGGDGTAEIRFFLSV
jgi:hypothetical protein